jgi:hypothetical protein
MHRLCICYIQLISNKHTQFYLFCTETTRSCYCQLLRSELLTASLNKVNCLRRVVSVIVQGVSSASTNIENDYSHQKPGEEFTETSVRLM